MTRILETVHHWVWGVPTLVLILGVGVYLSLGTGFAQLRLFPRALGLFWKRLREPASDSGISPYRALCTALAATVGTGNLAGVAGAIAIGGPGAIFWMWISAIFGMVTKYAEAVLAIRYRSRGTDGWEGGPMHMIRRGLAKPWHFLAGVYCFFGVVAAFGMGNCAQINAIVTGIHSVVPDTPLWVDLVLGIGLGILIVVMLRGGARAIGSMAEALVPFASVTYLILGLGVLILRRDRIGDAFASILLGAFQPRAVTGGMVGSVLQVLRIGVSRGVFTNEAGMGTASIAHACAECDHPAEQGLMGMMEVFLDTVVICTMTALVILCSGVPVEFGRDTGLALTVSAYTQVYGDWAAVLLTALTCCFAFATVLGWGLYGIRCARYLFGKECQIPFAWLQGLTVILGALLKTPTVWLLSETVNGLMAIPNLLALILLSPELIRLTGEFTSNRKN